MATLSLPSSIISRIDISRLLRELGALDEYLIGARIRNPHATEIPLPRLSLLLELVAKTNNINLSIDTQRQTLVQILVDVRDHAPSVQVSFASNPSAAMVEKLVQWFRREAHPYVMLQTGLQPGLAAGAIVRTPNKVFDLSLRKKLNEQKPKLVEAIKGMQKPVEAAQYPQTDIPQTVSGAAPVPEVAHG